jgi:hypothetical protein
MSEDQQQDTVVPFAKPVDAPFTPAERVEALQEAPPDVPVGPASIYRVVLLVEPVDGTGVRAFVTRNVSKTELDMATPELVMTLYGQELIGGLLHHYRNPQPPPDAQGV